MGGRGGYLEVSLHIRLCRRVAMQFGIVVDKRQILALALRIFQPHAGRYLTDRVSSHGGHMGTNGGNPLFEVLNKFVRKAFSCDGVISSSSVQVTTARRS